MSFAVFHPTCLNKALDAFIALASGLVFYVLISQTRPDLFTLSTDGLSYFVPLISAVHKQWLSAEPLQVLWSLGEGWVPWESGQIGYLYPVYTLAQAITNHFQAPLYFLEISSALHLALMSFFAWLVPPVKLSRSQRLIYSTSVLLLPGYLMIGMNWHNYLSPLPWFVLILGLFLNTVVTDKNISFRRSLAILLASAMFFSASHPQMYVLGTALLGITAVFLAPNLNTVFKVALLALLQAPLIPSLAYLYFVSVEAAPIWTSVREQASTISTSIPLIRGLSGTLFSVGSPALFNPILLILITTSLLQKRYLVAIGSILFIFLIFPAGLPENLANLLDSTLPGFRWPAKLVIFSGPLFIAALVSLRLNKWHWAAIGTAALLMFIHNLSNNHKATSLSSTHKAGIAQISLETKRCIQQLNIQAGDRIAFVGNFGYLRDGSGIPLAMHGVANNAAILWGLQSHHLYEPLEPAKAAAGHQFLTNYWRKSILPSELNPEFIDNLQQQGVDLLLATNSLFLEGADRNVLYCDANVYAVRITASPEKQNNLYNPRKNKIVAKPSNGDLLVNHSGNKPPNLPYWRVNNHPDGWEQLSNNQWLWNAPLPAFKWLALTFVCWLFALLLAWKAPQIQQRLTPQSPI